MSKKANQSITNMKVDEESYLVSLVIFAAFCDGNSCNKNKLLAVIMETEYP
jgi:hypothetical protein